MLLSRLDYRRIHCSAAIALILLSVFVGLVNFKPTNAQGSNNTLPVVAVHVSENTESHWTNVNWAYWAIYASLEEILRSDGTPFVEISDSTIEVGGLLDNGEPKYPILISLAAECISDLAVSQIRQYASVGGFIYVGSSAWTRYSNGTARGNFALSAEMGVTCTAIPPNNWNQMTTIYKNATNRLVDILPAGVNISPWNLPLNNGTSIQNTGGGNPHYFWQAYNTAINPADIFLTIPSSPYPYIMLATKAYSTGRFIYHSEFVPLVGEAIYAPGIYEYYFFRRAIEWAFESRSLPLVKLSPWPYQYDSAFLIRHDADSGSSFVLGSAMREKQLGVTGQYFIMTGLLLDDPNNASLISQLQQAQNTYGAQIAPHNGGLNSHYWLLANPGAYEYYHWGPDICIVRNGTGDYPPYNGTSQQNPGHGDVPTNLYGKDYANMSIRIALDNLTSWLGQRPIIWVSPWADSSIDASLEILESQGIKCAQERNIGPFPSMAFSLNTKGKYYDVLETPSQPWAISTGAVYQRLEEHSYGAGGTMQQMIDFLYGLGAMVNMYGHVSSSGGIGEAYITYCKSKPNMWNATPTLIRDWWLTRRQISITPTFEQSASGENRLNVILSGSTSADATVELVLPTSTSQVFNMTIYINGVPSTDYRKTSTGIKVKVGTATALKVTWESPPTEHWTQTTKADFESGILTNLDTSSNPGLVNLATQSAGGTNVLFLDDFSNSTWTNSQWTVQAGTWTVTSGLYQGVSSGANYQYTYAGNTSWTDYTVDAMTKWVSGSYGALIGARLNPSTGARYSFWIDSGTSVRLLRWSSWTAWTQIGSGTTTTHDSNWHRLRMELAGSSIKCYYDGVLAINAIDLTYSSGAVNFESYGSTVQYDWVNVTQTTQNVYYSSGTLVSEAFDAGFNAKWLTISWAALTPTGATVNLATRTAPTQAGLSSASWSAYYAQSGSAVTSLVNRWIQYEAVLSTSSTSVTPTLDSVSIAYTSWNNWTQTSEADFESGTPTNINTTAVPGQITIATASVGSTVTVFNDSFSDSGWTNSHWTVHSGTWTVTSGLYQGGGVTDPNYAISYAGDSSWANYTLEAMTKSASGSNYDAEIAARLNPTTGSRYAFWIYPNLAGPNIARLVKFSDWTTWTQLGQATVITDYNWHRLRMELAGSSIKCYYDGSLVLNVVDTSYPTGAIDFETGGSTTAQYDWVNVTQSSVSIYYSSGTLVSAAFDAGFSAQWRWITWNSSTPAGTAIEFRTRTAPTQAGLNSASWSGYYTDPGYSLVASPTNEWIQHEATLSTSNTLFTPTLYDSTIWYLQSPPYGLTVSVVGQGSVNLNNTGPYQNGDVVQLTALPAGGWSFASWSDNVTGSTNPTTITITGNMVVTATFTRNTYTLSVLTVGSGSVTLNNSGPYYYGDAVEFTASPTIGWSFQSWSGGLTGSANPATLVMNNDKTVTATFTQNAYTLAISLSGQGSVSKSPDQATYTWGTNVTLTANGKIGWAFASWSGGASGTVNPVIVNITGNTGVTATFNQIQYTLTVNIAGSGVVNLNNTGPYHYGDVVRLAAVPAAGWSFDHWSGGQTGSDNPAALTITGNVAVTAHFMLPQLYVNPSPIQKGPGDTYTTFQTNMMIDKIADLWGFDFKLTWDNNLIALTNVDFNTTLNNIWGYGNWYLAYNATGVGYYELAAVSTSTGFTSTTPTSLATLTFTVKAAVGQTPIHFTVVKLSNSQAQQIPVQVTDGTYQVTGPQYLPVLQTAPSSVTCRKYGEYFTVQVNVTNAVTLDDFSFTIQYDAALINYVGVTWGELGSGTITNVDPVNGVLEGNVAGAMISGNRWLINITFQDTATMIWKDGQPNKLEGKIWLYYAELSFSGVQDLVYEEGGLGQISVNDVDFAFAPIQGDLDNSGVVDISDLRTVAAYFDVKQGDPLWPTALAYDLYGDGVIDIFDLVVVGANFGHTYIP